MELLYYVASAADPTWDEVGFSPFIILLQTLVAAWVLWSVSRRDARLLLRNLLLAFGGSFVVAYGWYFLLLLLGGDGGGWVGVSNLLYLVGALFVAGGRLTGAGARVGNDRVRSR